MRWMTKGGNAVVSACGLPELRPCQCASSPSPRQETMPMPVMKASRPASAMDGSLDRQSDFLGDSLHAGAKFTFGKVDHAERDLGVADRLAVAFDLGLGHGEAGSLVDQLRRYGERLARCDEGAELGLLDAGE